MGFRFIAASLVSVAKPYFSRKFEWAIEISNGLGGSWIGFDGVPRTIAVVDWNRVQRLR
jgi:hypothetical protein